MGRLIAAALLERARLYVAEGRSRGLRVPCAPGALPPRRIACPHPVPGRTSELSSAGSALPGCGPNSGASARCISVLSELLQKGEASHRNHFAAPLRVALALALPGGKRADQAMRLFAKALKVAAPAVFSRRYSTGWKSAPCCRGPGRAWNAREREEELPYVDRLLEGWRSL